MWGVELLVDQLIDAGCVKNAAMDMHRAVMHISDGSTASEPIRNGPKRT